jgi:lysophospholipase L1-like esterase
VSCRIIVVILAAFSWVAGAASPPLPRGQKWVASWTASVHGPYPSGNPVAQPVLDKAFESSERGAVDQTFRLIVRPSLWGPQIRLRFANTFGNQAVTLDDVFVGLQSAGGVIAAGTNQSVTFDSGKTALTLPAGGSVYSDAIALPFVVPGPQPLLQDRKLAISFHAVGATGPMTWHAKALQTSYLSPPRSGSRGARESEVEFPFTTTSWYFLDAIDVQAGDATPVIACLGDSITDGTGSTPNGDDRWPDFLIRRLRAAHGARFAVVNAGIGGNRITGPSPYDPKTPFAGGPSALDRLERDVLSLPGLSTVIWLEGINDLSSGASADAVVAGITEGVRRVRARGGIRIIMATITPALGATAAAGTPEVDARRQAVNAFIRSSDLFDGIADFDAATRDPRTGGLRAELQPNSSIGGPGDALHPNRAGYLAMANAVDLGLLTTPPRR